MILCNVGEVYIFEHGCYISALEHARMLILTSYVLLACTNNIQYKQYINIFTLGGFSEPYMKFQFFDQGIHI